MRTDKKLNLVTSVDTDAGELPVYVYCMPLPYEVIEQYHMVLSRVFNQIHTVTGPMGGARTAHFMLKDALREMVVVEPGAPTLLDEIARLTMVAYAKNGQWQQVSLENALGAGVLSREDWGDVQGEVVNFIVASAVQKRDLLPKITGVILSAFGALLTPLDFTAYLDSLPKLKQEPAHSTAEDVEQTEDAGPDGWDTAKIRKETRSIPS